MEKTSYRILADGVTVSNDTWQTGLANNDLIVGPTGGGKTRGYVLPNLLSTKESFIVTDTKGVLKKQAGGILERRGFRVLEVDLSDLLHSPLGYNPLNFIRWDAERDCWNEQDIMAISAVLVPHEDKHNGPFWENAARMMIDALISYTLAYLPPEEHSMVSVTKLFAEAKTGVLAELMEEAGTSDPDSFTIMRWKYVQSGKDADRMYGSILGIVAERLSVFSFGGAQALFLNTDQIDFAAVSHEPTAVFLKVSDSDFSLARLTSLFYAQALQALIAEADARPDNRLKVPVRLYLDDFSNLNVPDFDKTISIIRSREISVSVILQSITQLEGLYGYAKAMTIIDNCDHLLYLGGQSLETARFIGFKADKPASAILRMPLGKAWLFERGALPREVRKYDLKQHPLYCQLPEYTARRGAGVPYEPAAPQGPLQAAAGM